VERIEAETRMKWKYTVRNESAFKRAIVLILESFRNRSSEHLNKHAQHDENVTEKCFFHARFVVSGLLGHGAIWTWNFCAV
jgi:hypothetical protein